MKTKILWIDDEIDLLKPHIIFLEQKDYEVDSANNGNEALEMVELNHYDIVFLDENMPGLTGIETLELLKLKKPSLPVVMITKSEEEHIMEEAIGSNIADYLIKPVKPNQILLCLKKNLDNKKLQSEKATLDYQKEFRNISMQLNNQLSQKEWIEVYKKLVHWELNLESKSAEGMEEILKAQKEEANLQFCRFVCQNYAEWVQGKQEDIPTMSHTLIKRKVFPILEQRKPVFMFVIDNLRFDQWRAMASVLQDMYRIEQEDLYFSILPTATQYARNAIFSGLMPSEIQKKYPKYWLNENEEGGKNQFEPQLLEALLNRFGKNIKSTYHKVLNLNFGRKVVNSMHHMLQKGLNVIVYNFVDMLSHARTDTELVQELANNESAYRSLTISWFEHSPLYDMFKFLSDKEVEIIITTDHGSIQVNEALQVIGDRDTNTNLRYKVGKSLSYDDKEVFTAKNPTDIFLPKMQLSDSFIFAQNKHFFAYRNNFNHYVKYYKNTFQHGGISLEEVLIPFVHLRPKV